MRRILPLIAVLLMGFAPAPDPRPAKKDSAATDKPVKGFHKFDYEKALARAKKDKKVVMIAFYADWCGPCKRLDAETFSQEKVQHILENKTIAIKINIDTGRELTAKFKVEVIPCLVFIDGDGKDVGRLVGYRTPESFLTQAGKFAK
jgi:thiol:disulfide interchange protein